MQKTLLQAANGQKTSTVPLWLMRQAGRYLPEYRALRSQHKTLKMFQTPEIACEITLQPLRRFPLTGAILYADILLIPDAMGLGLSFVENEGPVFERNIRSQEDLQIVKNSVENVSELTQKLRYVGETLKLVKPQLKDNVTLLGFAGAPFTVASYMVEGRSSKKNFLETKKFMFNSPNVFHELMSCITTATIDYLKMQIKCGAEVVQLFESWSGALSTQQYKEFCFPYMQQIISEIKKFAPVILYLGEGATLHEQVLELKPSVYSVDWHQDFKTVAQKFTGSGIALQGNIDPMLFYAPQDRLKMNLEECLKVGTNYEHGYIFNLGHGCLPTTPLENVEFLTNFVAGYQG